MDCPGPNDIDTVTAPHSSPSEQLYWTIDQYLDSVDMKAKSVGEIVAGMTSLWSKFYSEKYAHVDGVCDENLVSQAPMILRASIDKWVCCVFVWPALVIIGQHFNVRGLSIPTRA